MKELEKGKGGVESAKSGVEDETEIIRVIMMANTFVESWTVMTKTEITLLTDRTMMRTWWFGFIAFVTMTPV